MRNPVAEPGCPTQIARIPTSLATVRSEPWFRREKAMRFEKRWTRFSAIQRSECDSDGWRGCAAKSRLTRANSSRV